MAQSRFQSVLSFDMRAPDFGAPTSELYDAALDMCAFGDELGIDGVIFPEHHASEDGQTIAVTDIICRGRLTTTLAAGYVRAEFNMFGKSLSGRARLMDEGLDVITRAPAGERFMYADREIFVRPLGFAENTERVTQHQILGVVMGRKRWEHWTARRLSSRDRDADSAPLARKRLPRAALPSS
jgi:hypothetical protein